MRILIIEDEFDLAEVLRDGLTEDGHQVDVALDGNTGERMVIDEEYDLIIVDWMLPGQDGLSLVRRMRDRGDSRPVLMLTAMADISSRVSGLDGGADDYLTKPFAFAELYARVRALSRRSSTIAPEFQLQAGPLHIDTLSRVVTIETERLDLRPKEYALLELFVRNPHRVLTRTVIAERVWGTTYTSDDVINMTISSLRQKLRDMSKQPGLMITTMRGVGYRLDVPTPAV
jgi:DNA-binding response OmpR family regulator